MYKIMDSKMRNWLYMWLSPNEGGSTHESSLKKKDISTL